jgi:glycolate oxidase
VLPESADQVQAVVRACHEREVPWVARGAGSCLSGGALPVEEGVLIVLSRMNRILDVDLENQRVVVEPGVTNIAVSHAVAPDHFFPPDPSSQIVCTIGGNVAENSGGAHCFKYGFTTNYVTGLDVVLANGDRVQLGGKAVDMPGYDLLGAFVGSEGTLGVAVSATLRVVPKPEAVRTLVAFYESQPAAGKAVSDIVSAGIIPGAMEMMDKLAIEAAEQSVHAGFPTDAGAALVVELDGSERECDTGFEQVKEICDRNGATGIRVAEDDAERAAIWQTRKAAFAAMGRISPNYFVQDSVIPRTRLPQTLERIEELAAEHDLRVANVFHAGDGNLHPLVLYDGRVPGEAERAEELATEHDLRVANVFHAGDGNLHPLVLFDGRVEGEAERAEELAGAIVKACVDEGGSITGEHGVGVDKKRYMPAQFGEPDLAAFQMLRCAFDPGGLANPGKLMPTPRLCGEVPGPYRQHPLEAAGIAERF